jgi:hypothetical protein
LALFSPTITLSISVTMSDEMIEQGGVNWKRFRETQLRVKELEEVCGIPLSLNIPST